MNMPRRHTTVGLKKATKARLDEHKAPGQCYDGFLSQLVDMWESASCGARDPGAKSSRPLKK